MSENFALFKEFYGRKIKTVVEDVEKITSHVPGKSDARLLAGYTSPVMITSEWQHDGTAWKCWALRLFRIDGVYHPINDGVEFELYCPTCLYEQPPLPPTPSQAAIVQKEHGSGRRTLHWVSCALH